MKIAPCMFLGHGSPINVIEENNFNKNLNYYSKKLANDSYKGIIAISAHWQTDQTQIHYSKNLNTIYDFYGFPEILYQMKYEAHGSLDLAHEIANELKISTRKIVDNWGLDHGMWNVLWHLIPKAQKPIIPLSLGYGLSFKEHFDLGKKLNILRKKGYLILCSGNIVHSFKGIVMSSQAPINSDAEKFNNYVKANIRNQSFDKLIEFDPSILTAAKFSINSTEHYIPLLYFLGSLEDNESIEIFSDEIVYSTLSMSSFTTKL